nr:hypothetical protein [Angustibacter aerolatus]
MRQCLDAGITLTTEDEAVEVRRLVEERTRQVPAEDLDVLGYWEWLDGLERGSPPTTPGCCRASRRSSSLLVVRGLVRCVFATETLALGINVPARSVVLEKLVKWNGEAHVDVTPGEYTR